MPAESIDDAVERLVRHRLLFVTTAGKQGDPRRERGEKLLRERRLAGTRLAVNVNGDSRGLPEPGVRRVENRQLVGAADERQAARSRCRCPRRGAPIGEKLQDFRAGRTVVRLPGEQRQTQFLEIRRNVGSDTAGGSRVLQLLRPYQVGIAGERNMPGESLVQHRPHRVPVARRGELDPLCLFWRHVGNGTHEVSVHAPRRSHRRPGRCLKYRHGLGGGPAAREFLGDPEVENDHAPVMANQHVRRLEIAVKDLGGVQRAHSFGQLPHHRAKRVVVDSAARGSRADVRHEIDAIDQFHREQPFAAVGDQLVEGDEVGMDEIRQRSKLPLQPEQRARVHVRQRLESHGAPALAIDRLVDDTHAALTDLPHDRESVRGWCDAGSARRQRTGDHLRALFERVEIDRRAEIRKPEAQFAVGRWRAIDGAREALAPKELGDGGGGSKLRPFTQVHLERLGPSGRPAGLLFELDQFRECAFAVAVVCAG